MAVLSRMYEREGQRQLQEIIVNSQTRVHEQWSYDNWNGGAYGHALYIVLPERRIETLPRPHDVRLDAAVT